jgi:hypothetical protein
MGTHPRRSECSEYGMGCKMLMRCAMLMTSSRYLLSWTWRALFVSAMTGCGIFSPEGRVEPAWTSLGLEGHTVTAVTESPWGLYAGTTSSGVFRYDATTKAWQPAGLADEGVINDLLYVPTTPPRLLAAVAPREFGDSVGAVVLASDDGSTWVPSDDGYARAAGQRAAAYSFLSDPPGSRWVYVSLSGAVMLSGDGGETWHFVFGNAASEGTIPSIRADASRTIWLVANYLQTGSLFHTADRGNKWYGRWVDGTEPHYGGDFNYVHLDDVAVTEGGRIWLAITFGNWNTPSYAAVGVSRDTGKTVERASASGPAGMVGSVVTPMTFAIAADTLYAVGQQEGNQLAVYRLRPGRTSWDAITVPPGPAGGVSAAFDDQGRLLVGTAGTGVWRIEW